MSAVHDDVARAARSPQPARRTKAVPRKGVWAHSRRDAMLVLFSVLQGIALLTAPSILLVSLALWWCANTVAHNFIHVPFFRSGTANRAYSIYLSVLLGFPQSLWHAGHLAHHSGRPARFEWRSNTATEMTAIAILWTVLLVVAPTLFLTIYLPGYLLGLSLCLVQGHFEHAPSTASYYGRIYNAVFFNDGYHCEHHAAPQAHWTTLPARRQAALVSRWPPILRWIETINLDLLERVALRLPLAQSFLLHCHEVAIRKLLPQIGAVTSVTIVGGGLFPRSALVCRKLFPQARIRIVDASAGNLETARALLGDAPIEYVQAKYSARADSGMNDDLVLVPLALIGCRQDVYFSPPGRACLVHDWLWNRRSPSAIVSLLLLKRINLVLPA